MNIFLISVIVCALTFLVVDIIDCFISNKKIKKRLGFIQNCVVAVTMGVVAVAIAYKLIA